ncbi:MAG: CHRD domain-containing protein, partial [Chloroflexi bacterium]|nr:CHRD domain-containing protein [Chloroflexota bacterium]
MHIAGQTRNRFNLAAAIVLIIGLLIDPLTAVTANARAAPLSTIEQQANKAPISTPSSRPTIDSANVQAEKATKMNKVTGSDGTVSAASTTLDTYIVVLNGAPLASYRGGVANLAPTNPTVQGRRKLDARSAESRAYLNYLEQQQADFIASANKTLGRPLDVLYTYKATVNGFAAKMTAAEAQRLAKLPEVRRVEKERIYQLQTDAGPAWLGAPEIWGGNLEHLPFSATLSGANEVPAVVTTASGVGAFAYNLRTRELTYTVQVADIANITLAHIHRGAAGVNGPVAYMLYDGTGLFDPGHPISGVVTLSEADQALLMNRGLYVNVHTTANPGGEMRGQLVSTGTLGEGIVVGVIDTGIDPFNPSFAATGGDGYTHTNPLGAGHFLGVCDPSNVTPPAGGVAYDPTFPCNNKLIGVWGYTAVAASPRDSEGHGSHTASTAAGNIVKNPVVNTPTGSFTVDLISGVAPHANIIAYGACCAGSSLQAARDQALLDGVDVINYSIGASSPTPDPYNDVEALSWLALRDAGVFVATSAGNDGPGDSTVGSPADLPWLTSAGASSHNRAFISTVTLNDGAHPPLTLAGMALTTGYGPVPIVLARNVVIPPATPEDARFCALGAFPPGTFSGQIVVCERGVNGRVEKGQSVKDGGAGGMVLGQPNAFGGGPGSITADTHVLPASHIDFNS